MTRAAISADNEGHPIRFLDGRLDVPDDPIIPFIRGDGPGPHVWAAARMVLDAAVLHAYEGKRRIVWLELYAGEEALKRWGVSLPQETIDAFRHYHVGIKGPLVMPPGERSLNVQLRQLLDLYACVRPVRYFAGAPSPVRAPESVDVVIFRENTEDIYAGVEFAAGSPEARAVLRFLKEEFPEDFARIRFGEEVPEQIAIGFKPVSRIGTERLVRAAIRYAIRHGRRTVTLAHKGNIMKFTEGAFRDWGYAVAEREFPEQTYTSAQWARTAETKGREAADAEQAAAIAAGRILVNDVITDNALQQVLTREQEFDVVATLNLNGDFLSDAFAAEIGGVALEPSGNINEETGHAIFESLSEPTSFDPAPDRANPSSLILSGAMLLDHLGWMEAAACVRGALRRTFREGYVTDDFAPLLDKATRLSTEAFGRTVADHVREEPAASV